MTFRTLRPALAAIFLMLAPAAFADDLPAPVNGITFEEWAAGNARLAVLREPIGEELQLLRREFLRGVRRKLACRDHLPVALERTVLHGLCS